MTVQTSAGITSDGIVFCLDAGNPISYPKTGSNWFDVAGRRPVSIVNSPTYNTSKLGYFSFNGTTNYLSNVSLTLSPSNGFTISMFFRQINPQTNTAGWNYFSLDSTFTYEIGAFGSSNFYFKDNSIGVQVASDNVSSDWTYIAFGTESGSRQPFMYTANTSGFTETTIANRYSTTNLVINDIFRAPSGSNYYRADVAYISAYNRKLSFSEFKDNYFALRSRFF